MGIIRFLLAIAVVIAHSTPVFGLSLVGGQIAVQSFYIISGFYMALILNEKYIGVNKSYKLFISNRFLRLFPIYWVVLILTVAITAMFQTSSGGPNDIEVFPMCAKYLDNMGPGSIAFLAFTNLFVFFQDIVMYLGVDTSTGNLFFTSNFRNTDPLLYKFLFIPQAWTIGIELAFYVIAPFLAKRKLKIIISLIILSLLLRFALFFGFDLRQDPWTYRFFPTELVFFLLGIVAYNAYKKLQPLNIKTLHLKMIWFAVLAVTILFSLLPIPAKSYLYLGAFFVAVPFIFILTKKWKYDTYIGELSYPIYISHLFVLACLTAFNIPILGSLGITLTIATTLFSILLNELVAKRIEKIRQRRVKAIRSKKPSEAGVL